MTGMIFNIQRFCTDDGPGIRTTVFFKGCNLRCAWCHNPESQAHDAQIMFYPDKCVGCGKCKEKCPHALEKCDKCGTCAFYCIHGARELCGKEYSSSEVMSEVLKDTPYYESSDGGVTFSGGECMLQIDFLCELLKECKEAGIHTSVDTAGHIPYEYFEKILPYTDLFLYDVKCFDSEKHKKYTGVGNGLILKNLEQLLKIGKPLWVRIPIIPSVNDTEDEIRSILSFINTHGKAERVELLPYHALGEHKYAAIGKDVQTFSAPDDEKMTQLRNLL